MVKDYKKMWEKLEKTVQENISYYQKGFMCSIAESTYGEICYKEIQKMMKKIEEGE